MMMIQSRVLILTFLLNSVVTADPLLPVAHEILSLVQGGRLLQNAGHTLPTITLEGLCERATGENSTFPCACNEAAETFSCEFAPSCDEETNVCSEAVLTVQFKDETLDSLKTCMGFTSTDGDDSVRDGCLTLGLDIQSETGHRLTSCKLETDVNGVMTECNSCTACTAVNDGTSGYEFDCGNIPNGKSSNGCQVFVSDDEDDPDPDTSGVGNGFCAGTIALIVISSAAYF
jgi:hypothetical protein